MAAKSKAAKAGSAALAVKSSPYVQRLMQDEDLRENLKTAFDSARVALDRLNNGKAPAKVILDDKKFQKELHNASEALRDATQALREGPKKRKRRRGRKLLLLIVTAGVALAVSEGLRNKVLDLLFGAEEEFDYTSTTAPAAPPPPTPAATAS